MCLHVDTNPYMFEPNLGHLAKELHSIVTGPPCNSKADMLLQDVSRFSVSKCADRGSGGAGHAEKM